MEHVLQLEAAGESIRSAWREWNPQREAARALEAAVKSGAMTLQVGRRGTLQYSCMQCRGANGVVGTVLYSAVQRGTVQHSAVRISTVPSVAARCGRHCAARHSSVRLGGKPHTGRAPMLPGRCFWKREALKCIVCSRRAAPYCTAVLYRRTVPPYSSQAARTMQTKHACVQAGPCPHTFPHTWTQETIDARTQAENNFEPLPGSIPPEDSLRRGWYPHGSTFKWPAPRLAAFRVGRQGRCETMRLHVFPARQGRCETRLHGMSPG
eukprot:353674-Chlamydomonas_euryale.AAC.5